MDAKTIESLKEGLIAAGIVAAIAAAVAVPLLVAFRLSGKPFRTPWPFPGIPKQIAGILLAMFPIGLIGFHVSVAVMAGILPLAAMDNPESAKQLRQVTASVLATPERKPSWSRRPPVMCASSGRTS